MKTYTADSPAVTRAWEVWDAAVARAALGAYRALVDEESSDAMKGSK